MPCAKLRRSGGIVSEVLNGTRFAIRLPDGTALIARTSRRLVLRDTHYAVGDAVQIGMLPDRRGDGLILTSVPRVAANRGIFKSS
jgi:translation initiation factor IF-1